MNLEELIFKVAGREEVGGREEERRQRMWGFSRGEGEGGPPIERQENPYPILKGFENKSKSSCFIDSLLVAMFGPFIVHKDERANEVNRNLFSIHHSGENFWNVMFAQPVNQRITAVNYDAVCHDDENRDIKIRQKIQEALRRDVKNLLDGNRGECSLLRGLIGKVCRKKGAQDLATGYQDPVDIYDRLLRVFAFTPIWTHKKEVFGKLDKATNKANRLCTKENEYAKELEPGSYINVDLDEIYKSHTENVELHHAWKPRSWEKVEYDCETVITCPDGRQFRHPNLPNLKFVYQFFDHADVFVARVFRWDVMKQEMSFTRSIKIPDEIVLEPLNFQKSPQTARQDQNLKLKDIPKQLPRNYRLMSAVLHQVTFEHYTTLLSVPNVENESYSWYFYDDLLQKPYEKITDAKAEKMLKTQSVMLFYFPYGQPAKSPEEKKAKVQPEEEKLSFGDVEVESMREARLRTYRIVENLVNMGYDINRSIAAANEVANEKPFESIERDIYDAINRLVQ
jgi:hypothetical protein